MIKTGSVPARQKVNALSKCDVPLNVRDYVVSRSRSHESTNFIMLRDVSPVYWCPDCHVVCTVCMECFVGDLVSPPSTQTTLCSGRACLLARVGATYVLWKSVRMDPPSTPPRRTFLDPVSQESHGANGPTLVRKLALGAVVRC